MNTNPRIISLDQVPIDKIMRGLKKKLAPLYDMDFFNALAGRQPKPGVNTYAPYHGEVLHRDEVSIPDTKGKMIKVLVLFIAAPLGKGIILPYDNIDGDDYEPVNASGVMIALEKVERRLKMIMLKEEEYEAEWLAYKKRKTNEDGLFDGDEKDPDWVPEYEPRQLLTISDVRKKLNPTKVRGTTADKVVVVCVRYLKPPRFAFEDSTGPFSLSYVKSVLKHEFIHARDASPRRPLRFERPDIGPPWEDVDAWRAARKKIGQDADTFKKFNSRLEVRAYARNLADEIAEPVKRKVLAAKGAGGLRSNELYEIIMSSVSTAPYWKILEKYLDPRLHPLLLKLIVTDLEDKGIITIE